MGAEFVWNDLKVLEIDSGDGKCTYVSELNTLKSYYRNLMLLAQC